MIATGLVCLFLANQIVWAYPVDRSTLAPAPGDYFEQVLDEMLQRQDARRPQAGVGLDGNTYPSSPIDRSNIADSNRRLAGLLAEIRERVAERGVQPVSGQVAVSEAEWLLGRMVESSNCTDTHFREAVPHHLLCMRDMAGRVTAAAGVEPTPELFIA
jgi:hypothetical protein